MAKRKELSADDILKQMYPDLQTSEDAEAAAAAKLAAAKGTENDAGAQIAQLQQQIAQLQGVVSTVRTPEPKYREAQRPQKPVMGKAPDPIQDPDGYANFVQQATSALIDYEKADWQWQQGQAATAQNRTGGLWGKFEAAYTDYAAPENSKKVEIAAKEVLQRAQAAGMDTDQYMYSNSEAFMRDVVNEYDGLFGKAGVAAGDDDDDDDDNRATMFDGSAAGANGVGKTPQPPERFGALSQGINAWQEKTGFHR